MAEVSTLSADLRDRAGTGGARAVRRDGKVPGVIYGDAKDPLSISVDRRVLDTERTRPGFFTRLVDIQVGGQKHRVLPREVQLHPVTDAPLHIDLMRANDDTQVTVEVPVRFINEAQAPGIKRGGVLNIVRHSVEVRCRAASIPTHFEVDLTGLEIGGAIHSSRLVLPEGVVLAVSERDFTIATIAAPTVIAEEAAAAAAAAAAALAAPTIEGEPGAEGAAPAEGAAAGGAPGAAAPAGGAAKPAAGGAKPAPGAAPGAKK